jgi:hypothetical protein
MAREDSNVDSISDDYACLREGWIDTCHNQESLGAVRGFSIDRWNRYRDFLMALHAEQITKHDGADHQVFIRVSTEVGPTDDNFETEMSEKGYVYSSTEPAPLLISLDGLSSHKPRTVYT